MLVELANRLKFIIFFEWSVALAFDPMWWAEWLWVSIEPFRCHKFHRNGTFCWCGHFDCCAFWIWTQSVATQKFIGLKFSSGRMTVDRQQSVHTRNHIIIVIVSIWLYMRHTLICSLEFSIIILIRECYGMFEIDFTVMLVQPLVTEICIILFVCCKHTIYTPPYAYSLYIPLRNGSPSIVIYRIIYYLFIYQSFVYKLHNK